MIMIMIIIITRIIILMIINLGLTLQSDPSFWGLVRLIIIKIKIINLSNLSSCNF
jgi:hypothetical protein